MSTDNLTADRLSQLLSSCRERAALCASAWITGTHSLGEIYEEIESWYDRYREGNLPMPQYQDLPSPVQDQLFDAWIEGVEGYFAKRAAKSDSAASKQDPASLFSRMAVAVRAAGHELSAYHMTGQPSKSFTHSETLVLSLGDLIAELNRLPVSSPSHASSPSQPLHATEPVKASPEGSVCKVEPLGEVMPDGGFVFRGVSSSDEVSVRDAQGTLSIMLPKLGPVWISKDQVRSLIAHLTAWLETGSFKLVPRAVSQSTDQSSLLREAHSFTDKTLLYLDEALIHSQDGRDAACEDAIKLSRHFTQQTLAKLNTAFGEEQKGGEGVLVTNQLH